MSNFKFFDMAFTLKGFLHRKGEIDTRSTDSGNFSRQEIVLKMRRFDSMTGEEMKSNFVVLEASTPALIYEIGRPHRPIMRRLLPRNRTHRTTRPCRTT